MAVDRSLLLNRRVVVAVLIQIVGYAALLAVFPHSEPSAFVEALGVIPWILLIPFAIPAIPATVLTIAIGAILSALGLSPEAIPALLLARGDVLFFVSAYVVGVGSAWANEKQAELEP